MRRHVSALVFVLVLAALVPSARASAPDLSGTFEHQRDSDGTTPKKGATVTLTFKGGTAGTVSVRAVQPGQTIAERGTYAVDGDRITLLLPETGWEVESLPFTLDGCTLTLPFLALSESDDAGTSTWRRQDPACTVAASNAGAKNVPAPVSYAAEQVTIQGGRREAGKLFVTPSAVRAEGQHRGAPVVTIARLDRGVLWTLRPGTKTFTESPLLFGDARSAKVAADPACRAAGEEVVAGVPCLKEQCRRDFGRASFTENRWTSKANPGVVVRYDDGEQTIELHDLRIGPQDPALFEIPKDYRPATGGAR